jgi:lycopene beta-cyclase
MSNQKKIDVIIAGGGIAGMTLAYFLSLQEKTKHLKTLVIDQGIEIEFANVSFWATSLPIAGMPLVGSWRQFEVMFEGFTRTLTLNDYTFYSFNRADYLSFLKKALIKKKVAFHTDSVVSIAQTNNGAKVRTKSGEVFEAAWVFDSTHLNEGKTKKVPVHGWTWEIETSKTVFAAQTMTLFDFEATKLHDSFLYVLPLDATKAIVEFSSFSHTPSIGACEYWLANRLQGVDYKMVRLNQKGASSYQTNSVTKPARSIPIGLKAGNMSTCSGYAYMNIVRHCQLLAKSYPDFSSVSTQKKKKHQVVLDYLFNLVFARAPRAGVWLLMLLFKQCRGDAVLAYLDGELSPVQIMRLPFGEKS